MKTQLSVVSKANRSSSELLSSLRELGFKIYLRDMFTKEMFPLNEENENISYVEDYMCYYALFNDNCSLGQIIVLLEKIEEKYNAGTVEIRLSYM